MVGGGSPLDQTLQTSFFSTYALNISLTLAKYQQVQTDLRRASDESSEGFAFVFHAQLIIINAVDLISVLLFGGRSHP